MSWQWYEHKINKDCRYGVWADMPVIVYYKDGIFGIALQNKAMRKCIDVLEHIREPLVIMSKDYDMEKLKVDMRDEDKTPAQV